MAVKKTTKKLKSRTANNNTSQLTQFKFRWWMALVLVAVVAIIGIVIVRFSHAATTTSSAYEIMATRYNNPYGDYKYYIVSSNDDVTISYHHTESNGIVIYYMRNATISTCGYVFKQGAYGGGYKDTNAPKDPSILYPGGRFLWANSTCDYR